MERAINPDILTLVSSLPDLNMVVRCLPEPDRTGLETIDGKLSKEQLRVLSQRLEKQLRENIKWQSATGGPIHEDRALAHVHLLPRQIQQIIQYGGLPEGTHDQSTAAGGEISHALTQRIREAVETLQLNCKSLWWAYLEECNDDDSDKNLQSTLGEHFAHCACCQKVSEYVFSSDLQTHETAIGFLRQNVEVPGTLDEEQVFIESLGITRAAYELVNALTNEELENFVWRFNIAPVSVPERLSTAEVDAKIINSENSRSLYILLSGAELSLRKAISMYLKIKIDRMQFVPSEHSLHLRSA